MRNYITPIFAVLTVAMVAGCGSKNEQAGTPCSTPDQCYPDVQDKSKIMGQVVCLTQYPGGYCTHTCTVDTDCCAVSGECRTGFKQVCSAFENQTQLYCLLSCADADIAASPNEGVTDPTAYCQKFAGSTLTCRSSGGGNLNRKFCG